MYKIVTQRQCKNLLLNTNAATTTYFLVICSRNGLQITFKPTDASTSFVDITVINTFLPQSNPVLRRAIIYTNVPALLLKITNLCFKIYNNTTTSVNQCIILVSCHNV